MKRTPLGIVVFAAGALLSATWAFYNLRPLKELFGVGDYGGGGLVGYATSVDVLGYIVAPLIAWAISRRVRERTGVARIMRRAHLTAMGLVVAVIAAFVAVTISGSFANGVDGLSFVLLAATFIGGALWLPLQGFFAAGFLGLLINEKRPHV